MEANSYQAAQQGAAYEIPGKYAYRAVKRLFDIVVSLTALVILSPVMLATMVLIKAEDGGSVFYASKRVGTGRRVFSLYKFRSMYEGADKHLEELRSQNDMGSGPRFKMKDDPRVTKTGRFIRKYSIDELPQLVNVLKGDISCIGPRPHSVYEVEKYPEYAMRRFSVKAGLLCYSECMGRSDLPFEESIESDLKYVEERGIITDIKILFMAADAILTGKGAK